MNKQTRAPWPVLGFLLTSIVASAQVTQQWVARYDGPASGEDQATAIAVDSATGNVYVTGYSMGVGTGFDYATVAYDSNGNQLWAARYNGPGNGEDRASAIAFDSSTGNIYVTGASTGAGTGFDYATVAYDSNGNQLWEARYDGPASGEDQATAITVDSGSGNVYVTGYSFGVGTDFDFATVAYCSGGSELWVARYDGPAHRVDKARAIAFDPGTGNIYVTGEYHALRGCPICYYAFATLAYDSSGNQVWLNEAAAGAQDAFPKKIAVDSRSGNVYVHGENHNPVNRRLTVAYDSSGNDLWGHSLFLRNYFAGGVAVDSNTGRVYVTGTIYDVIFPRFLLEFDTVAFSSDGNQLWEALYRGPNFENRALGIVVDPSTQDVYVTGTADLGTGLDYATVKYSQP